MPVLRGRSLDLATDFGAGTHLWFAVPTALDIRAVMTFRYDIAPNYHQRAFCKELGVPGPGGSQQKETKTILRAEGPAAEGFFYVVYPRKDGEAAPKCELLAPGCLKIVTPESTDYAFVSDEPVSFEAEGVVFAGRAGAVRVFADRVALCLAAGSGRVGYRGCVLRGHGPFEQSVALADLKTGEQDLGGYEKKIVSADVGQGVTVRGEGPFEARLDGQAIRIRTTGRARTLVMTIPPFIVRPDLFLDGRRWMAGWSDWASSDWGRMKNSYLMAVSTLDGEHDLVIRDLTFPRPWARRFEPTIAPQR